MWLDGLDKVIKFGIILLVIFVPLGAWKAIEITSWLFTR